MAKRLSDAGFEQVVLELPCALSESELVEAGRTAARLFARVTTLEEDRRLAAKAARHEIDELRREALGLLADVRRGAVERAARLFARVTTLEEDRRLAAKAARHEIDELRREALGLIADVRRGAVERAVRCELRVDRPRGLVETWRTDTGELVAARPLTDEERQGDLFMLKLDEPPAAAPTAEPEGSA